MASSKHNPSSRTRENFRRRKYTLLKKAHEIEAIHDAKVGVFIYKSGQYFTYNSNKMLWPLWTQIVSIID